MRDVRELIFGAGRPTDTGSTHKQGEIMKYVLAAVLTLMVALLAAPTNSIAAGNFAERAQDAKPLPVGTSAPQFTAYRADGSAYEFDPGAIKRPAMLIFYRGGWCPFCNMHLAELRHCVPEIQEMGYEVLFLSADRPQILYSSLQEENRDLDYTLLSDSKLQAASAFGIAFQLDARTLARYRKHGLDLAAASGETHNALPVPSVFIVDTDGVIKYSYANPDFKVRLDSDEILAAARSSISAAAQ